MPAIAERSQDGLLLYQRLVEGDEQGCRDLLHRLAQDEGASVLRLCEVMTEAFKEIGDAWECSQLKVYREHIASQIGYRVLLELRGHFPAPERNAPVAIGCTPEEDPYVLPTTMVELVLRDCGWRAQSLGSNLPLEMLGPAMKDLQPQLCWVSISYTESADRLRQQLSALNDLRRKHDTRVVCGGRAIDDQLKNEYVDITFLADLSELQCYTVEGFQLPY